MFMSNKKLYDITVRIVSAGIFVMVFSALLHAEPRNIKSVPMPEMPRITASVVEAPPKWAVMERHLIKTEEEASKIYLDHFVRSDGTIYGGSSNEVEGAPNYDDLYEMFHNWGLFYAIGADEQIFLNAVKEYNAVTRMCSNFPPYKSNYHHQLYNEFPEHAEWFHIGEGMMLFYDLAIGDPSLPQNIDRAKRFAGFYLGEDPESKSNYDPKLKLMRSTDNGSKGASETGGGAWILANGAANLLPVVKKLDEGWEQDPVKREKIYKIYDDVVRRCDIPVNLGATALVTNAYLYTGDEKYKKWVLEYVEAWMQRIKDNNGILPDNIGRTGKIGEYRNGQFWGGLWGWYPSYYMVDFGFEALTIASECAYLISGDPKYLDLIRSQLDVLEKNAKTSPEGEMLAPHNYGPDGWINFKPMSIRDYAHLWHASMDKSDWERIERVRKNAKLDWNIVPVTEDRRNGTDHARLMYYAGDNPDWPFNALEADYKYSVKMLELIKAYGQLPRDLIQSDWLYHKSPVLTKALMQVTMGAPQTIYNGGLLRAQVRYFDIDRVRPGLPKDVAALVEKLSSDKTVVTLVNISSLETRRLIVQAGAFGEHNFTNVAYKENTAVNIPGKTTTPIPLELKDRISQVNGKYFTVEMPPGTVITLDIGMQRYVNKPSYAFPWHGGSVPQK
jgi:hypothetical protein